jgi:hypothetical protein
MYKSATHVENSAVYYDRAANARIFRGITVKNIPVIDQLGVVVHVERSAAYNTY